MSYTIDELQNPITRTTILFEGHMNSTFGRSDDFPNSKDLWLVVQHCVKEKGAYILIAATEKKIPKTVWVFHALLADTDMQLLASFT